MANNMLKRVGTFCSFVLLDLVSWNVSVLE